MRLRSGKDTSASRNRPGESSEKIRSGNRAENSASAGVTINGATGGGHKTSRFGRAPSSHRSRRHLQQKQPVTTSGSSDDEDSSSNDVFWQNAAQGLSNPKHSHATGIASKFYKGAQPRKPTKGPESDDDSRSRHPLSNAAAEISSSSSVLRRVYALDTSCHKRVEKNKCLPKPRKITGINRVPLSFIAKRMNRSTKEPFCTNGPEYRAMSDELHGRHSSHSPAPPPYSPFTVGSSNCSTSTRSRKGGADGEEGRHIQRVEVFGHLQQVVLEGNIIWRASQ